MFSHVLSRLFIVKASVRHVDRRVFIMWSVPSVRSGCPMATVVCELDTRLQPCITMRTVSSSCDLMLQENLSCKLCTKTWGRARNSQTTSDSPVTRSRFMVKHVFLFLEWVEQTWDWKLYKLSLDTSYRSFSLPEATCRRDLALFADGWATATRCCDWAPSMTLQLQCETAEDVRSWHTTRFSETHESQVSWHASSERDEMQRSSFVTADTISLKGVWWRDQDNSIDKKPVVAL